MTTRYKTIRISAETYENLAKEGSVLDSFDDVIGHLLRQKQRNAREKDMDR